MSTKLMLAAAMTGALFGAAPAHSQTYSLSDCVAAHYHEIPAGDFGWPTIERACHGLYHNAVTPAWSRLAAQRSLTAPSLSTRISAHG
jgi:hypothetical protein